MKHHLLNKVKASKKTAQGNKVTRDIMAMLGVDANTALLVQGRMMENGVDFSECTRGEFNAAIREAAHGLVPASLPSAPKRLKPATGSVKKKAFGYYNFEWQGNDALLVGPSGDTILLSGKSAREFQDELEHIEEVTPNSESLEQAVNEYIAGYFSDWQEPTEEEVVKA